MNATDPSAPPSCLDAGAAALVLDIAHCLTREPDRDQLVDDIMALLEEYPPMNKARVLLPDLNSGALHIRYAHGLTESECSRGVYRPGEGVTGRAMASGRLALIPDVTMDPDFLGRVTPVSAGETRAYIAVPLVNGGRVLGVLGVLSRAEGDWDVTTQANLLQAVAAIIAQVLKGEAAPASTVEPAAEDILGRSRGFKASLGKASRAAGSAASVMLTGESGTGKERFARRIHDASPRRDGPFVGINCAAIPEHLMESELFGHEKGAFTGASHSRQGRFEQASGGTLFLDEIGEMNLAMQTKLLRVLQDRAVQRLGGDRELPVDVRIIAATNRDLEAAVRDGDFRLDLYYRLNVVPIHLPPLRQRRGDIRLLAEHFLHAASQRYGRALQLSDAALGRLEAYHWPGNIRQLENVIERLAILSDSPRIDVAAIDELLTEGGLSAVEGEAPASRAALRPYRRVDGSEGKAILAALERSGGNKTRAALELGMTPRQLRYRAKKLGLA